MSMKPKRRRVEDFGIEFAGGYADGWAYGVVEAHRLSLDIVLSELVDKDRSTKARKVLRFAWTRGSPPACSFQAGDLFYAPPLPRGLPWHEAEALLESYIQVVEATPDDPPRKGMVKFELVKYSKGARVARQIRQLTQGEFADVLRDGMREF